MNSVEKRIASLIIKQYRGELSVEESIELEQWANQSAANRDLLQQLTNDETLRSELIAYNEAEESKDAIWKKIDDATSETTKMIPMPVHHNRRYRFMAAAVTVAAVLTTVAYFLFQNKQVSTTTAPVAQTNINDVLPGGNKAILKLSDGKTIVLDDAQNGVLAKQGNASIIKQNDGELIYKGDDGSGGGQLTIDPSSPRLRTGTHLPLTYNILSTPAGGQFRLKLPDGTHVWLNAESSITYPTAFTGNERRVTISGEGYFEVAPVQLRSGQKMPFIVTIQKREDKQSTEVEVLGTHFNINAYDDEALVKTSLLEGKVKIVSNYYNGKQTAILKPGQQAQVEVEGKLKVKEDASMEEVIAWKNGDFLFQSADIGTLMRQVARWYDIKVSYPNGMPKDKFSGKIGRNVNLNQLLEILRYSEVKFDLKGRTLVVHN